MTEPRWLTADERAAWLRLAALLQQLPAALDAQLNRDEQLTHFEYFCLAMLSEAPERTLRMTMLAQQTNATLPRLSHVVRKLEGRGFVERFPCPQDARAVNARLTPAGWDKVVATAPGHVAQVRDVVVDALTPEQLDGLAQACEAMLGRLDPEGAMTPVYHRHDPA